MDKLVTSNSDTGIYIHIKQNAIIIKPLPSSRVFSDSFVVLYDKNNQEMDRISYSYGHDIIVPMSAKPNGIYSLCIYKKTNKHSDIYYSYIHPSEIVISKEGDILDLVSSILTKENMSFYNNLKTLSSSSSRFLLPTQDIQSTNLNITNLAKQIAEGKSDITEIIRAVHAWVALNLSYDYDSLNNESHINKDNTALGAYVGRRCVCRGYTNITIALLRTLRIPAIRIFCNAQNTTNFQERIINTKQKNINHVFPSAWNGNRWILMDPTWDSRNVYENGQYKDSGGMEYPYKYFDVTIEFLSHSHYLISYDA